MAYNLFLDSFDTDGSTGRWTVIQNSFPGLFTLVVPSSGNGRRSSSSLRMTGGINTGSMTVRTPYFTASTHAAAGAALKTTTSTSIAIVFQYQGSNSLIVTVQANGFIQYRINNGATTNTSKYVAANSWVYLEAGVIVGESGSFVIKANGEEITNVSSVNTKPGGTQVNIDSIALFHVNQISDADDFYVAYGDEVKFLGDVRVDALDLAGNATPQDWTPDTGNAWERLNATAGYITGTTLGDESRFEMADYTAVTTAIYGIQVSASARKTDAGSRSFAIEVKSDSTTSVSSAIALGDTTTEYRYTLLTDPDTATAWTDGGIDALQVGVKVAD